MKTAKRALSVFLALMMTLGLLPSSAAAGDLRAGRSSLSFTPAEGLTLTVGKHISTADGIMVGTVSGGTGPYVFFESDDENGFGTIGLLLDDTGAVYGTPTEVGTFTFGITVEDYGNQYDYGNQHDSVSGFVTITVSDGAPPVGTTYTVTWDPDGGTFADSTTVPAEVTVEAGNSTTVPEVTRDGCAFLGWSSDGGGTYLTGDTVTPTADVTYTAQWAVLRLVEISPTDQITLIYPDQTDFTYTIDSADYDTALGYGIVTSTDDTIFTVSDTADNTTYTLTPLSVGAAYLTIVFPADDANHYHRTTISIGVEVAAGAALTAPRLELFNAATADEDAVVMITPVDADRDKIGYHFEYEKAAAEPGADPASVTAVAVGDPYTTFTVPAADVGTYWVRAAADNYTPSGWTSIDVTRDYTITIQPGDHAAAGETDKTATVQSGVGTYTLPAANTFAAAEGYAFDGWLVGGEKMDAGASVFVADDMTITAQWKADSFAVSLEETSEVIGREIAGPTLRVGYAAADIAATPISFYNLSSTPRQFTLTYDAAKVTIYSDSACTATVNNNSTIARDAGTAWTLYVKPAAGLGAAAYSADVTVANDRGMSATATYQFTVSTIERSIVWNDSFPADAAETTLHSGGDASVRSGAAGSTITLPTAPAAAGYVFLGWFDAADGGDEINADYTVPALNEALNLYAHWAKNYALNKKLTADGDAIKVADHHEGETFALPAAETRNGYAFDKWNDGTADYDAGAPYTMPAADVTITAKWKTNEITYTYADVTDAKVGTAITPVTPTASGTDADSGTLAFTDESGIGSQLSDFGLALDGTTGEISGAPIRAASAQAFTIGYTARNGYEGTATFTLTAEKGAATLTTTPVIADDWTYDVASHALVKTPGAAENGEVQYSVNGGEYSAAVPQATDAGAYTVKYQVVGAADCDGIGETELGTVTVGKATLTAGDVSTHSATFDDITYNGQAGALTVTAKTQDFTSGMVTSFDAVTYTRASADAGDGVAVDARITAITSDNYRLPEGGLEIGNVGAIRVEPAELTIDVSCVRAAKVYDGDATIGTGELTGAATLETGIGGETATVTGASYAFNSADVESASTVTATITGFKVEAGSTDVSANYKLPDPAAATTAAGTGAITAAKLAAPTGTLTASADGADQITVGGAAASEGTLTYVITAPDAATGNVTGAASGVFTGLEPETAYTFAAYAKSEDANHADSDPTATATATTLPAPTYALVIVTSDTDDTAVDAITVEADAYG